MGIAPAHGFSFDEKEQRNEECRRHTRRCAMATVSTDASSCGWLGSQIQQKYVFKPKSLQTIHPFVRCIAKRLLLLLFCRRILISNKTERSKMQAGSQQRLKNKDR